MINIELHEITKDEKIFRLYKKMKNKKEQITNVTLFYYVDLVDNVTYLLNVRQNLIIYQHCLTFTTVFYLQITEMIYATIMIYRKY